MKTKLTVILVACLFIWNVGASFSDDNTGEAIKEIEKRVVEKTLPDGFKVIILKRSVAPLVSYQMVFRAGAVDEVRGKSGLAHLFEHMMFKGTRTVGTKDYGKEKPILDKLNSAEEELIKENGKKSPDPERIKTLKAAIEDLNKQEQGWVIPSEFDQIYQKEGAQGLNAYTGEDMTGFVVNLPANKWELWPMMESDRMSHPVLREFYKEKDVVMEERRMRTEDNPQGKLWEDFLSLSFKAHPYHCPPIGWTSDIKNLTVSDAESYFLSHYAPNDAVVAVVGDVDPQDVGEKMERYFSSVSSHTLPDDIHTLEPEQDGFRCVQVQFESEPTLLMGFHKPNAPHRDNYAMEMIEQVLSRGRSSRFHRDIVEKKIALSVWASNGDPGERYPNLIVFGGEPQRPHGNQDLEKAIWKELDRLKDEKVTEKELEKIKNGVTADFVRGLASNSGMASQLSYDQAILGDWRYVFRYLDGLKAVTPEDVQRAARAYLKRSNETFAFLEKPLVGHEH